MGTDDDDTWGTGREWTTPTGGQDVDNGATYRTGHELTTTAACNQPQCHLEVTTTTNHVTKSIHALLTPFRAARLTDEITADAGRTGDLVGNLRRREGAVEDLDARDRPAQVLRLRGRHPQPDVARGAQGVRDAAREVHRTALDPVNVERDACRVRVEHGRDVIPAVDRRQRHRDDGRRRRAGAVAADRREGQPEVGGEREATAVVGVGEDDAVGTRPDEEEERERVENVERAAVGEDDVAVGGAATWPAETTMRVTPRPVYTLRDPRQT